jgi:hypothetical protein
MQQIPQEVRDIIGQFVIYGDLVSCKGFGNGHINTTLVSTFNQAGVSVKYTHQKINRQIFTRPDEVMENISLVTSHIREKLEAQQVPFASSHVLTVVPAKDGRPYAIDSDGEYWRTYLFVDRVFSYEKLDDSAVAGRLGAMVGLFQSQLSDLDGGRLHETISRFHDMRWRYEQLREALSKDAAGRAASCGAEIDFLFSNEERGVVITDLYRDGKLRKGITHNDTKLNNVLFDEQTHEAACVIDLDTVMPGTILFDTGDMIRTATITGEEDERELSLISCDVKMYRALMEGYLSEASAFLSPLERSLLAESGRTTTLIMAVRFLTDYLNGDVYYKISRPGHNLDRMRTQMRLIESMDAQWEQLESAIR